MVVSSMDKIEQEEHWRTGCIVSYLAYKNGRDDIEYLAEPSLVTECIDLITRFPEIRTMYPKKIIPYLEKHDRATTDRRPDTNKSVNITQSG